jgi:hypothetical protein
MVNGDETANSYKTSAELLLSRKGDKAKIINYLFRAADLYSEAKRTKSIECLDELHNNLKGSTSEFGKVHYYRYMHQLARAYEDHNEIGTAADVYTELAQDIYNHKNELVINKIFSGLEILKKFCAYLAKALMLYDSVEKYESIMRIAKEYHRVFPSFQGNTSLEGELYFCYEHIIHAADVTGSRYFREYYAQLDNKLRGIEAVDEPTTYQIPEE